MSLNTLKKMIVFSSEKAKKIVENLIADEAVIENRSASALIEKHLLNDLLPEHKDARYWIELLYSGKWGVGDVLNAAFEYNGHGVFSKWNNYLPLVQFAHAQESYCNSIPTGEERELHHFRSKFDSICVKLEDLAKNDNIEHQYFYSKEAQYARELLKEATEEPQFMRYCNFYQIIMDNWDVLKNLASTYCVLMDLAAMEKGWINEPDTRYELTQILKRISKKWDTD